MTCFDGTSDLEYVLPSHGGRGGIGADDMCAVGTDALVGLSVRAGGHLDAVSGVCANMQLWSSKGTSPLVKLPTRGGGGGGAYELMCKPGSFLSGWRIHSGSLVNRVDIICRDF